MMEAILESILRIINRVNDYLAFAFCVIVWSLLYFVFYTSGIKLVYDRSTSWKEQMTWY